MYRAFKLKNTKCSRLIKLNNLSSSWLCKFSIVLLFHNLLFFNLDASTMSRRLWTSAWNSWFYCFISICRNNLFFLHLSFQRFLFYLMWLFIYFCLLYSDQVVLIHLRLFHHLFLSVLKWSLLSKIVFQWRMNHMLD